MPRQCSAVSPDAAVCWQHVVCTCCVLAQCMLQHTACCQHIPHPPPRGTAFSARTRPLPMTSHGPSRRTGWPVRVRGVAGIGRAFEGPGGNRLPDGGLREQRSENRTETRDQLGRGPSARCHGSREWEHAALVCQVEHRAQPHSNRYCSRNSARRPAAAAAAAAPLAASTSSSGRSPK